jgi:hypothetical protein
MVVVVTLSLTSHPPWPFHHSPLVEHPQIIQLVLRVIPLTLTLHSEMLHSRLPNREFSPQFLLQSKLLIIKLTRLDKTTNLHIPLPLRRSQIRLLLLSLLSIQLSIIIRELLE